MRETTTSAPVCGGSKTSMGVGVETLTGYLSRRSQLRDWSLEACSFACSVGGGVSGSACVRQRVCERQACMQHGRQICVVRVSVRMKCVRVCV